MRVPEMDAGNVEGTSSSHSSMSVGRMTPLKRLGSAGGAGYPCIVEVDVFL